MKTYQEYYLGESVTHMPTRVPEGSSRPVLQGEPRASPALGGERGQKYTSGTAAGSGL